MTRPLCVVTETDWVPEDVLLRLGESFELLTGPFTRQELINISGQAAGFFVGLDHMLDSDILSENNSFIVTPTTGLNHIDLGAAQRLGIEIFSLKGETEFLNGITATAELCWGLILALSRRIMPAALSVEAGEWDRDRFRSHELQGATLGVIGLGRLGKKIARYGLAFDMRVIACDIRDVEAEGVETCELDRLLSESDIITLHADSRPENHHMIGREQFALMKKTTLFINTARGDLVDEAALLAALRERQITGAALDVLQNEYGDAASSSSLVKYAKENDTLIITPHIGGATYESQYKTAHFAVDKLLGRWAG